MQKNTKSVSNGLGRGLDALIPVQTVSAKESEVSKVVRANLLSAATVLSSAVEGMSDEESKKMLALIAETATWMLATDRR